MIVQSKEKSLDFNLKCKTNYKLLFGRGPYHKEDWVNLRHP